MANKRVAVRLVAEGGRQVRAEFEGVGESGKRSFEGIERQADLTGAAIRRLAGILGAAFSVRQIVQYADTWTDLRSRVDLATGSQEAGALVMERLSDMARRTYSSLEQTAESWLANATALRELGLTARESLDFTEALNNAMVVSGARAERAASIQNALAQAMALGELRGQQLNTVIQNGGRVAELLAAELGVNVNQLRRLGAQGLITGDVIRRALVGNLETLREEADAMPATIGDAFTLMGNAALRLVGTWDTLAGASATVAAAIIHVADNLERLAAYAAAFAAFAAGRWVVALIAARVATLSLAGALALLRAAIIRTGIGALIVGAGELVYWFGQLARGAGGFGTALNLLGDVARAVWKGIKAELSSYIDSFLAMEARGQAIWLRFMRFLASKWSDFIGTISPTFNRISDAIGAGFELDALGTAAWVSSFDAGIQRAERRAEEFSARAAEAFAGAYDGVREAVDALGQAVSGLGEQSDEALDRAAAGAGAFEEALEQAGRAAGRAGGAAGRAGAATREAGSEAAAAGREAATGWAKAVETLDDYAARARDAAAAIGDSVIGAFRGAEDAVAGFVETGKLGVRDMVTSIIADLARLAARRFLLGPLASALSGVFGGFATGGVPLLGASVLHAGGIAGTTALQRPVPALAFADAPRLHGGGFAGLRPDGGWTGLRSDEVPAILQRGERVLSRREARADGGSVVINIQTRDAESFRQSRTQVAADIARAVSLGRRGL